MTSEDFLRIFYSNFSPNIDWANIDEIAWMHQEGLFTVSDQVIALSTTEKMLILPYPHSADVQVFQFEAKPRFFEYIKHKQSFLNRKNAKLR